MKRLFIKIYFILFSSIIFAQSAVKIEATLLDKITKEPISYANIGFFEKAIGTVSDENGHFTLLYNSSYIKKNEPLQISTLGYESLKIQIHELFDLLLKNNNKIFLNPEPLNLNEIRLTNEKREQKTIGINGINKKAKGYWYWMGKHALGGEIATRINIKKRNTKLLEFQFYVKENLSDSIMVRINVYNYEKKGFPNNNLLSKNIYHVINKKAGIETIDLKPYDIVVNDDIVIGIELIKIYGDRLRFEVAGNNYLGPSYTRYISQDKWKRNIENGVNFSVLTSIPTNKDKDISIVRTVPERIILYWDTSLSMQNRAIDSELQLLEDYLNKVKNTSVEVVKFSTKISESKVFPITRGNSDELIEYLKDTEYEGATNYADILKENTFDAQTILVFTDGNAQFEALKQLVYVPAFYINTSSKANKELLQKQANYGEGHFIDLLQTTKKDALNFMLNEIEDETVYEDVNIKVIHTIYGSVTSDSLFIQGAKINVKNSYVQAISDVDGNYKIEASEDDILQVSALGMLPKEVLVSNQPNVNINLKPDGQLLDEVLLRAKAKKEIVLTPFGKKDINSVGYSTSEITSKDISASHQTLEQLIAKLPGIMITGIGERRRYSFPINTFATLGGAKGIAEIDPNPVIVIDDVMYMQSDGLDKLPPIDLQTIVSIKAIKSVVGTNRYGSAGAYGAIEIRTSASALSEVKKPVKQPSALAQGNDYLDEGISFFEDNKEPSKYIKQLSVAATFEEAKNMYYRQKNQMQVIPTSYVIEASEYFEKWDKDFAYNVLSNIAEFAYNNPKALLSLAYNLDELKYYEQAKYIYERIAELRPKDAQSHRNLTQIYEKTKAYDKALQLYKLMLSNSIEGADFSAIEQVIANEFSRFLAQNRNKIDVTGIPSDYLNAKFKYDQRIVFEWNEPRSEFEFQFVNPLKKFYRWSHTQLENQAQMMDEINNGYAIEEYIIDDAEPGEWIINIENLTNETNSINPTYLKYTAYKNYGLPNETQTVKVVKLDDCNPKVTFDKFINQ
ncbi:MAG: carboxypeptidase-like regulatory domain-containing protein [Flavobacteriaceae bacterium]|nr:carboxypeptidase-like regulatory domain-containing protein [Flavobacteriaceae bacterium]